jgi:hypothetical protein
MINHPNRSNKAKAIQTEPATAPQEPTTVTSVKGFDLNFRCREFQYEVGKTYEHDGKVEICKSGFHACKYPLDVFGYYPPASSRYAIVEQSGQLVQHGEDKIVSARIKIEAEISLSVLIERAIKWVFDRSRPEGETATSDMGAASATGDMGAASATGMVGVAKLERITKSDPDFAPLVAAAQALLSGPVAVPARPAVSVMAIGAAS